MTIKNSSSQPSLDELERGEEEIVVPESTSEVVDDEKPPAPPCPSTLPEPDVVVGPPSPSNTTAKTLDTDVSAAVASLTNDSMEEANFPRAFYCPLTKRVMLDPVVHPSGDSFERAAAIEQEEKSSKGLIQTKLYPNRALKAYIENEVERFEEAGSVRGTIRKIDDTLRSGWDKIVDKTGVPLGEFRPLPDEFYCTLTLDLCHEPVIDPDGYTYEREAIVHWVQNNSDSPVTRTALSVDQLYDNNAVLNILLEESEKPDDDIHPCIRRWKEEMSNPTPTSIVPVDNGENHNYGIPFGHGIAMNDPNNTTGQQQQHQFPTNREQMDERIRQQNRMSMISLILMIVIISFALVYLPFYLVVFCMAFCSCLFARRRFQERRANR